jgi:hypothetical protein
MAKKALFVTLLIGSSLVAGVAEAAFSFSGKLPTLPRTTPIIPIPQVVNTPAPAYLTSQGLTGTCRVASASGC